MKLIIMTKSTFFVEEDKILATLFDEGMDNLHLYKPGSSPIYSERLLSLLPEDYHGRITVHDHFYLKDEYNLSGIHLDTPEFAPPSGYKGRIGRTCSDLSELKEMKKQSNYIFLKNIFDSHIGCDQKSDFTMNDLELAADKGLIDKKVYALGGMTCDNLQIARQLGFGGVVICNDLWSKFEIHSQTDFKELMNHFEKLKKIIN
ncbi:MAG: thiamine phosphate synthase [Prevotella sp.]